ncbi:MAG: hypothetical protein IH955_04080 [Chloroflexi bacterium]|nr:hypothetical protein [Chloroflexota bacterium]
MDSSPPIPGHDSSRYSGLGVGTLAVWGNILNSLACREEVQARMEGLI